MKSLIIVISIHHNNTLIIAKVIAKVINAQLKKPSQIKPKEIQDYDIVGFGSGIYSAKNHKNLINLIDKFTFVNNKKAFIFSTSGITSKSKATKDHLILREKLESKGFFIMNEFQCKGFNTNSFLKYIGGMNKGRPNIEDLNNAKEFARNLIKQ